MEPSTDKVVEFSLGLIGQWPEPMLLIEGDLFIETNRAAFRLLGYPDKSALVSRTPADLSPPFQPDGESSAKKGQRFLEQARQGETVCFEWVHVSASGDEIHLDVTLSPIQQGSHQLLLCAWHRIDRLKQAEKAARLANEALARSNQELLHFAQVAAHDLQTPLRTISAFTQLLHQEALNQLSEQARQWSTLVVDGSKRMQALIDDLLSYSRLDCPSSAYEPTDCRSVFEEVLANLRRRIQESGAQVTCGDLPIVEANRLQFVQVLQNLIENGIKYNTSRPPRVTVSARHDGQSWLFSVTDNGIGIDPSHQAQVFEMFRRLHTQQEYPGTGIGLAICQRIIDRHGGRIWVESEPGQGSTFCFTLPDQPNHPRCCWKSPALAASCSDRSCPLRLS